MTDMFARRLKSGPGPGIGNTFFGGLRGSRSIPGSRIKAWGEEGGMRSGSHTGQGEGEKSFF